jgi:hypothetical protein
MDRISTTTTGGIGSKIKIALFSLALAALPLRALGDDWSIRGGAAVINGSLDASVKIFGLRHEAYFFYGVYTAQELGGYVDNGGEGRSGSLLGKVQIGIKPGPEVGGFGKVFTGPCAISSPDSQLGSWYQWCTDFGIGIRDEMTFMDLTYSHISNAGVVLPNHGRDFTVMEMGFRF